MKKKVLALFLVLALTLAMMVPVFAATSGSACAVCGSTQWNISSWTPWYPENCGNVSFHYLYQQGSGTCARCGTYSPNAATSRIEVPHSPPCSICGMGTY